MKQKLLIAISFLPFLCSINQVNGQHCDFEISVAINIINETNNVQPGDTLCFTPGYRSFIQFKNIHGTANAPVIIKNGNGVTLISSESSYGIKLNNCSFIKLTGSGFPQVPYGISISKVTDGSGISIDNESTDVEIERVEVSNTKIGGLYAKTEPDYPGNCSFPAVRDRFTMYNTIIHDCYFHDIGDEGMYIGSSKYKGQTVNHCNDTVVLPHVLIGVKVYNNILERTGWDAIQVSSAVSDCEIFNNTVINDSYAEVTYQMSGILIGGGSNCDCYNNKILNGKGDGIDYLGFGDNMIYNNLIVKPGITYQPFDSSYAYQKHGIWIGDIETPANMELKIFNNTIINPRNYGLKIHNQKLNKVIIQNNIIADPMAYQSGGINPYYEYIQGIASVVEDHNYFTKNMGELRFVDPAGNNFVIKQYSPVINAGANLSTDNITNDIEDRVRPVEQYDIGAYEYQLVGIDEEPEGNITVHLTPNPVNETLELTFTVNQSSTNIGYNIYNALGEIVFGNNNQVYEKGRYTVTINTAGLQTGYYFVVFRYGNRTYSRTIIKQ